MKTRLQQVLSRFLDGRTLVVWGETTRRLLRELQPYTFHTNIQELDSKKHYVVMVTEEDLEDFMASGLSEGYKYPTDYIIFEDMGGELPFEWQCHGVPVGRMSYFGENVANACSNGYVKSIGHFTSINGSANIHVDHQLDMIFTSDDITYFFSDENKKLFDERHKCNPKNPYSFNENNKLTICSDVWIGANVFINCSKVLSIGDGAVIAAGAVVIEDVPAYAVVAGVPAKIKRYRFLPEMIETLLQVKWWNWSEDKINDNAAILMLPKLFFEKFGGKINAD